MAPEAKRAAGERLRAVFAKHGNSLHRKGYTKQTGAMQPLLLDLASATSQADLVTLDLLGYHAALVQAQNAFESLWGERADGSPGDTLPGEANRSPR